MAPRRSKANAKCGEGPEGRELTPFEARVAAVIRSIPKGSTLPYSGVALRAGKPGAARAVVRAMKNLRDIPWWRVIRRDGTVAKEVATEQQRRLAKEGVKFRGLKVLAAGPKLSTKRS